LLPFACKGKSLFSINAHQHLIDEKKTVLMICLLPQRLCCQLFCPKDKQIPKPGKVGKHQTFNDLSIFKDMVQSNSK
jgi:hypothetical protein